MRLPVDEVRGLSHDALTRNGLTAQEARTMPGVTEILIPGERAYRERAQRLKEGIELDDGLYAQLAALSQGEGVLRKA